MAGKQDGSRLFNSIQLQFENEDFSFCKNVLLNGESKFNGFGSDGKPIVWRRQNRELGLNNLRSAVKRGE